MKTIIVVTHAQSQHHVEKRVGGWYDTGLTELGKGQAECVAAWLREKYHRVQPCIFSSDLKRAHETAQPIAEAFGDTVQLMPGLREMSYGEAEGKEQAWLDERFVAPPRDGDRFNHRVCSGAESRKEFAERIYEAMDQVEQKTEDVSIVVSHGFAHTFIVSWWIGLPLGMTDRVHFSTSAAGITVLREDDVFHNRDVKTMNLIDHLD